MRVFVMAACGQLGWDVCQELERRGIEYRGISSEDLNITDGSSVMAALEKWQPDGVIHCAAYTKVDQAELEPELCWSVNVDGTKNIVAACRTVGAKLLYVSTDYVFHGDGERAYEPVDDVNPQNVYGISKLAGELAVRSLLERYFIVRTSWVFGKNRGNFVKTMLCLSESRSEVNVVCDQIGSPTYTADLAPLLCNMIATEKYGVYHATNEGICSWAQFATEIFYRAGKPTVVHPIKTSGYPTPATRPLNSRMSKDCLEEAGFHRLPLWQDALGRYLREIEELH